MTPHQPKICQLPLSHLESSPPVDSPHQIFILPPPTPHSPPVPHQMLIPPLNNNFQVIT